MLRCSATVGAESESAQLNLNLAGMRVAAASAHDACKCEMVSFVGAEVALFASTKSGVLLSRSNPSCYRPAGGAHARTTCVQQDGRRSDAAGLYQEICSIITK